MSSYPGLTPEHRRGSIHRGILAWVETRKRRSYLHPYGHGEGGCELLPDQGNALFSLEEH